MGVHREGTLDGIAPPHVHRSMHLENNWDANTDVGTARVGTSVLAVGPSDVGRPSPAAGLPGGGAGLMGQEQLEDMS